MTVKELKQKLNNFDENLIVSFPDETGYKIVDNVSQGVNELDLALVLDCKYEHINENKDPIFLLSIEEYEKYKNKIPHLYCWQWLRSPGSYQNGAAYVSYGGSVYYDGNYVDTGDGCVRPALNIFNLDSNNFNFIGDNKLVFCGNTWIKIDDYFYISETPIAVRRFDEKSNDYENSEIRKFLLDWYKERKDW